MKTSNDGIELLHYFESCKLVAYPDAGSKDGNPWTCGYGATGSDIKEGVVWTQEQADTRFESDLKKKGEDPVIRNVKVPLTQNQFDALVSWTYNLGEGNLKSSTLLKLINSGEFNNAAEQFLRWNKNDGKVMLGLTRRRVAEKALFEGKSSSEAIKLAQSIKG